MLAESSVRKSHTDNAVFFKGQRASLAGPRLTAHSLHHSAAAVSGTIE